MTASEKLALIEAATAAGRTVYVSNHGGAIKVTPQTAAAWVARGHAMFKVSGDSLYMARGKRWDCIDYCAIQSA